MKLNKRFMIVALVSIVGIMSVIGISNNGFAQCALTLGWEPWEPYQYREGNTLTGLDIDLIMAVMKRTNCKISLQEVPWARLLKLIEYGKTDLAMSASKNPEREKYACFSEPYRKEKMALFVRKGEASKYTFKTLDELAKSDFKIGVVREYYYGDRFAELLKDPEFSKKVLVADNENENYTKLIRKRIDGFLSDPFVAAAGLRKAGMSQKIETHPVSIYSNDIYVMFSKKTTTLEQVNVFNRALESLKKDGTYDKIIEKYLQK